MISFFIFFTIFLIAVEIYSYHNGLKKITYDVQPSQTLLEPDEKFKVNTIVENHKLWFLPYLHLIEAFPQNIQIPGEEKILQKRELLIPSPLSSLLILLLK